MPAILLVAGRPVSPLVINRVCFQMMTLYIVDPGTGAKTANLATVCDGSALVLQPFYSELAGKWTKW